LCSTANAIEKTISTAPGAMPGYSSSQLKQNLCVYHYTTIGYPFQLTELFGVHDNSSYPVYPIFTFHSDERRLLPGHDGSTIASYAGNKIG